MDISYFKSVQNATGFQRKKDVEIAEYQKRFSVDFDSSVAATYDTTRNDVPQDFIITPTKSGCKLWARPGETFNIGDIIFYNTLHWLVTDINFYDEFGRSGTMVRCNRQIRWQDKDTKEIVERWCLATAPYTDDLASGIVLEEPKYRYKIQIPYDAETAKVGVGHRFMLDVIAGKPQVYRCTRPDQNTNRYQDIEGGFIVWTMEYDQYNPETDNKKLMIADFVDSEDTLPTPPPHLLPCSIIGKPTIRCGMSRTYTAAFYLEDGTTEDPSAVASWTVLPPAGLENTVTWQANLNLLELTAADEEALIGENILISVVDSGGRYAAAMLKVEVAGVYG